MSNTTATRRTQAERRTESRTAVLKSACHLFGESGYVDTSLEEIAAHCGLTIRPIYHYFGNKKALFAAVNEIMELRIIASMETQAGGGGTTNLLGNWRAYLDLCDDPAFRRIVLVDGPNILGRERWANSAVTEKVRSALQGKSGGSKVKQARADLINAVVMGAFTEAALVIANAEDVSLAKREAEKLIVELFAGLH